MRLAHSSQSHEPLATRSLATASERRLSPTLGKSRCSTAHPCLVIDRTPAHSTGKWRVWTSVSWSVCLNRVSRPAETYPPTTRSSGRIYGLTFCLTNTLRFRIRSRCRWTLRHCARMRAASMRVNVRQGRRTDTPLHKAFACSNASFRRFRSGAVSTIVSRDNARSSSEIAS